MGSLLQELTSARAGSETDLMRPSHLPRPLGRVARRSALAEARQDSLPPGRNGRDPLEAPFAFLAAQGVVGPGVFLAAQARARELGVGLDDVLVASAALDDETLARGFARRWRLPFLDHPRLDEVNETGALVSGLASLEGVAGDPLYVVAPRGPRALALARALRGPGGPPDGRLAVASARALREAAFERLAPRLAREAAATLPRALSACRNDVTPAQAAMLILVGAVAAAALFGVSLAGALATLILGLFFLVAVVMRLSATLAARQEAHDAPPLADRDLPTYAVVVAMHREENVVADLVAALDRLEYPREKLRVSFLLEEDDAPTRAALAALALPPHMEVVLVAPGKPRTKPRALNVALAACDADLFVIYDAEDRPEPDQLHKAAARFARAPKSIACLQARLAIDNARENALSALFALDYAGLFEIVNPGFGALDWPMLLGGTSNHFRVAALRAVGGWDAWNVTEDADLGLRLARAGYSVETLRSVTQEEAPITLGAWSAQRRRWLKGWMQTALVHTRAPRRLWRELGPDRAIAILASLGGGLLSALLGPLFALRIAIDAARGDLLRVDTALSVTVSSMTLTLLALGPLCAILPPFLGARRAGLRGMTRHLALLPLYYMIVSWAAWRALIEMTHAPHVWSKPRHGVSRGRAPPPI